MAESALFGVLELYKRGKVSSESGKVLLGKAKRFARAV